MKLRLKVILRKGQKSYRVNKQDFRKLLERDAQRWTGQSQNHN